MKKLISILLTIASLLLLTACTGQISISNSKYYTDYDGIYITIDSVEGDGKEQKLVTTWRNETDKTVTFGYWYVIEYKDGEEWKSIQIVDYAIPEIACVVEAQSTASMTYSTKYFSLVRKGTYRLRSEFYVQTDADSTNGGSLYTEFCVE